MRHTAAMMILSYAGAVGAMGSAVFVGCGLAEKKLFKDSGSCRLPAACCLLPAAVIE